MPGSFSTVHFSRMTPRPSLAPDVLVLGGGLVGLSVAVCSAARGLRVTLVSRSHRGEASPAAAGILAPTLEHASGAHNSAANNFARAARDRYPGFLDWVAERTGLRVPLDRSGILEVALDAESFSALRVRSVNDASEVLDASALAAVEPTLAHCAGALLHPHDGSVDNVLLIAALREAVARSAVAVIEGEVATLAPSPGDAGIRVRLTDGRTLEGGAAVLATGAWAAGVEGIPRAIPVRPVRGQMIAFGGRSLRRVVYGPEGYLVPRASEGGRILAGATMEDVGFAPETTESATTALSTMARTLCPPLRNVPVASTWAGLRPVTPDLLPLIGADPNFPALLYACGHSRNGVLMAPFTGDCIAALVAGDPPPCDLSAFSCTRFA